MIHIEHVTKRYATRHGEVTVLDDVNLTIRPGEKVGILGRNGAGKSTIIRLISGAERPSAGHIRREMSVSWPLAFGGAFQGSLTGLDNLRFICRVYGKSTEDRIAYVQEFSELGRYLREPVKTYSAGMRARLAFAISMVVEFDCFLIDEIVAVGDSRFHEKCRVELFEKRKDRAMIIVSHDPGYVREHCGRAAVLVRGKLTPFDHVDEAFAFYQNHAARMSAFAWQMPAWALTLMPVRLARQCLNEPASTTPTAHAPTRQLLVDVSVIHQSDARTGIQRVVRALLLQLLMAGTSGLSRMPIFATRQHGYRYACPHFLDESFQDTGTAASHMQLDVQVQSGDLFLGLDLAAHLLPRHQAQVLCWKRSGVKMHVLVYDLLPLLHPEWFNPKTVRNFKRWIKWLAVYADSAICISETVKMELHAWLNTHFGMLPTTLPASTIVLGADIEASAPSGGLPAQASSVLARLRSTSAVLMVGTLEPRKGYDQALAAFEQLWQQWENAPLLVIVGRPGWKTQALQEKLRCHPQAGQRLFWLEDVSDEYLAQLYDACSGVLVASRGEGFGLPLVEAVQHGKPVLAREIAVFQELKLAGITYFHGESVNDLATVLANWLKPAWGTTVLPPQSHASSFFPTWQLSAAQLLHSLGLQCQVPEPNHSAAALKAGISTSCPMGSDRMNITSYAQNFEDVMLWRALGHIERGLYIDVGAQDPVIDSVSLAFHEHGWQGIHVEPTPHYAALLRQKRPGDTVIQAAVGSDSAVLHFFEIPDTGISTADAAIAAQHRASGFDVHETNVPCIPLSAVFQLCAEQEIHWLKIDVEGFEQQVLSSWGTSSARPWVVVVECTLPLTQIETHQSWEFILVGYGYTSVYFDGLNRYYVSEAHAELKAAFAAPPNVFDGFALNGTASAPFHQLIAARCQEKISEAEKQLAALVLSHSEQERTMQEHQAEQEQALQQKLQALQTQLDRLQQERAASEKLLNAQNSQSRQELERLLRQIVAREQEVAAQLLQTQQQAEREKTELAHRHAEHATALQQQCAEREQVLQQKLQALQTQLDRLQQERAASEKLLHAQNSQSRQELERLLRQIVQREQQVAAQLLQTQQQAEREKTELAHRHAEHATALQQQHDAELRTKLGEHQRVLDACAALESELKAQVLLEQQASLQLSQSLVEVQRQLGMVHTSRSWRLTAPLRMLAAFIAPERAPAAVSPCTDDPNTPAQKVVAIQQPINLPITSCLEPEIASATVAAHAKPSDSAMLPDTPGQPMAMPPLINALRMTTESSLIPSSAPVNMPLTPASVAAVTLEELLAQHNQYFIQCAYLTLLGREPDPEGLNYYLSRLRTGYSKIQILAQLSLSNEAKAYAAQLSGLDIAIARYQKSQYPLIGRLYRWINRVEGNHPNERKLRSIENQLFAFSHESKCRFNQLETAIASLHHLVAQEARVGTAEVTGIDTKIASVVSSPIPVQPPELEGLNQLSPRARDIYFQLKKRAAIHAKEVA